MEIIFLDENFTQLYVLDSFKSLIWTERYWKTGDFDLVCDPSSTVLSLLGTTKYFDLFGVTRSLNCKMRLETINLKSDSEEGDSLILQGRDLSSIIDQRIIWDRTVINGNLQTGIEGLMDDAIINPTDPDREISLITFVSSEDSAVTALTAETQFQGERLLYAISDLCISNGIGFSMTWNKTLAKFEFQLYAGVDRSFDQIDNAPVAFTSNLNNLLNADYVESRVPERNVCFVAGEAGIGNVRTVVEVGSGVGLARKETFFEASITRNTSGEPMSEEDYILALASKGFEVLAQTKRLVAFDGEVDTTMYRYGEDFGMGDILQIADEYGHAAKSRVVEMIYSQNEEGVKMYPTFELVEEV